MVSNSNPSVFLSLTSVPVCPHGGGVGLCEYIQHISIFDYICVSASLENRLEFVFELLYQKFSYEIFFAT